jgi:hypothetical protein
MGGLLPERESSMPCLKYRTDVLFSPRRRDIT